MPAYRVSSLPPRVMQNAPVLICTNSFSLLTDLLSFPTHWQVTHISYPVATHTYAHTGNGSIKLEAETATSHFWVFRAMTQQRRLQNLLGWLISLSRGSYAATHQRVKEKLCVECGSPLGQHSALPPLVLWLKSVGTIQGRPLMIQTLKE